MIRFESDRFVIEVVTGCNPVENWLELQDELLTLISCMDEEFGHKPYRTANFLKELLPDWEDARKMAVK